MIEKPPSQREEKSNTASAGYKYMTYWQNEKNHTLLNKVVLGVGGEHVILKELGQTRNRIQGFGSLPNK